MDNISYFISLMPAELKAVFDSFDNRIKNCITEIRIRRNKPVMIFVDNQPYFIDINNKLTYNPSSHALTLDDDSFNCLTDRLCNHSYHTNMRTIIDGYITTKHGCRVGVAGSCVYSEGKISSVRDITSLNIRIAKEFKDCSRDILAQIYKNSLPSFIVCGIPASGKTTFLRDISRLVSSGFNGKYKKTVIVDDRKEISGGFDIGINTDVLSGYEKAKGIEIATRTLSPEFIICDEIGNMKEVDALKYAFSTGVKFAVSVHTGSQERIFDNQIINALIETNEFDYIVNLISYTNEYEIVNLREVKIENYRNDHDNHFFFFPWNNGFNV